jgi:NAD-dependent deacetylase sirtuin 5
VEYDNFKDPVVPALELPQGVDISDLSIPLPPVTIEQLPHCPRCAHLLRPAVVWYSEVLPGEPLNRIDDWILAGKVDLMLVIGTRACVWPAADYIDFAREQGARVAIINLEDLDPDQENMQLDGGDWFFKGDAAGLVPEILKEVVGEVFRTGVATNPRLQ